MATTKFLKPNEVTVCKRLAVSDSADNKRATALLAIHTGETQVSAAAISGLTAGQVRYIVRRFRVMGLDALDYENIAKPKTDAKPQAEEKLVKKDEKPKKDKKAKKEKPKDKKEKDKKSKKKDKKSKDKKKAKKKK